jgi:hypothetical protein
VRGGARRRLWRALWQAAISESVSSDSKGLRRHVKDYAFSRNFK